MISLVMFLVPRGEQRDALAQKILCSSLCNFFLCCLNFLHFTQLPSYASPAFHIIMSSNSNHGIPSATQSTSLKMIVNMQLKQIDGELDVKHIKSYGNLEGDEATNDIISRRGNQLWLNVTDRLHWRIGELSATNQSRSRLRQAYLKGSKNTEKAYPSMTKSLLNLPAVEG